MTDTIASTHPNILRNTTSNPSPNRRSLLPRNPRRPNLHHLKRPRRNYPGRKVRSADYERHICTTLDAPSFQRR
jgi:hypothetical protein